MGMGMIGKFALGALGGAANAVTDIASDNIKNAALEAKETRLAELRNRLSNESEIAKEQRAEARSDAEMHPDIRIDDRVASKGSVKKQFAANTQADAAEAAVKARQQAVESEYEDMTDEDIENRVPDATPEYEAAMAKAGPTAGESGIIGLRRDMTSSKETAEAAKRSLAEAKLEQLTNYQTQLTELRKIEDAAKSARDQAAIDKAQAEIKLLEAKAERALRETGKKDDTKYLTPDRALTAAAQFSKLAETATSKEDRALYHQKAGELAEWAISQRKDKESGFTPPSNSKGAQDVSTANNGFSAGLIGSYANTPTKPATADGPTVANAAAMKGVKSGKSPRRRVYNTQTGTFQ